MPPTLYWQNNPHGYLFARPSDGLMPTKFAGVFADVLDHLGLRRDPVSGVFRTLYCCRHYYATQSLMDGVSITFLAENMGNSEAMIRTHYNHVITDLRSGRCRQLSRTDHSRHSQDLGYQEIVEVTGLAARHGEESPVSRARNDAKQFVEKGITGI